MPTLHIANTNFEWELTQKKTPDYPSSLEVHRTFMQLQYLPLLYADPKDGVMVSHMPPAIYLETLNELGFSNLPRLHLFSEKSLPKYDRLESWGASIALEKWAKKHQLLYVIPTQDILKTVTSKFFTYTNAKKLPRSALLYNEKDTVNFVQSEFTPKVLKACFGFAGRDLYRIKEMSLENHPGIIKFLKSQWAKGLPVIGEPWVNRIFDFSTQWKIEKDEIVHFLGATICENNPLGGHLRNIVGKQSDLFSSFEGYLNEHLREAKDLLEKVAKIGYFGSIGIDAMIYQEDDQTYLHPIVEINPRKTMGWVALELLKKHTHSHFLTLTHSTKVKKGVLPSYLDRSVTSILRFPKQLEIEAHDLVI